MFNLLKYLTFLEVLDYIFKSHKTCDALVCRWLACLVFSTRQFLCVETVNWYSGLDKRHGKRPWFELVTFRSKNILWCRSNPQPRTNDLHDGQLTIRALDSITISSKLVWECHQILCALSHFDAVTLRWRLRYTNLKEIRKPSNCQRKRTRTLSQVQSQPVGLDGRQPNDLCRYESKGNTNVDKDR